MSRVSRKKATTRFIGKGIGIALDSIHHDQADRDGGNLSSLVPAGVSLMDGCVRRGRGTPGIEKLLEDKSDLFDEWHG